MGDKVVGYAKKAVTEEDIETIMINGLEGGIGYWAKLDNTGEKWDRMPEDAYVSEWAVKLLLEGESITFIDMEDDGERFELTLEKLVKGVGLNAEERDFDGDVLNGDVITYDCIIQYALFDDVVYG